MQAFQARDGSSILPTRTKEKRDQTIDLFFLCNDETKSLVVFQFVRPGYLDGWQNLRSHG